MSFARLREGIAETDPMEAADKGFWAFLSWRKRAPAEEVFEVQKRMDEVRRRILDHELSNRQSVEDKRALANECTVRLGLKGKTDMVFCPTAWVDLDGPMWDVIRTWPEYQGVRK